MAPWPRWACCSRCCSPCALRASLGVNPNQHLESLHRRALCRARGSRLLLVIAKLDRRCAAIRSWLLGLAMIHHPLLAAIGASSPWSVAGGLRAHARAASAQHRRRLAAPARSRSGLRADSALCSPAPATARKRSALGRHLHASSCRALERRAAGIPVHPVQAYAALCLPHDCDLPRSLAAASPPAGDIAGLWLIGAGVAICSHRVLARPRRPRLLCSTARSTAAGRRQSSSCSPAHSSCLNAPRSGLQVHLLPRAAAIRAIRQSKGYPMAEPRTTRPFRPKPPVSVSTTSSPRNSKA